MKPQPIIWNMTRMCVWDCDFCCVDAYSIGQEEDKIVVRRDGLSVKSIFPRDRSLTFFDDVSKNLQRFGLELSLDEKLAILGNIDTDVEFDFSGGDPLLVGDNIEVIRQASRRFGKDRIEVTATGVGLAQVNLQELSQIIGEVGFTYDFSGQVDDVPNRPNTYNSVNISKVRRLKEYGVKAVAQIPLSKENISQDTIDAIFRDLHNSEIDKAVLMKVFNVGRGANFGAELPSKEEYIKAVNQYKELEVLYGNPKVVLQTHLRRIIQGSTKESDLLSIVSRTLNITDQGILTLSPWAYDEMGKPLDRFVLGDLKRDKLSDLYNSQRRDVYLERLR